jgi:putative exosortase-associated protein (TIGR04073 family)
MRNPMLLALCLAASLLTGCGAVERKLGRGMNNATEFFRGGELRRSIEQTGLWEGPDQAFTTGLVRGMGRTMARTAIGFSEVLTAPFPPYDPYFFPEKWFRDPTTKVRAEPFTVDPVYPDAYQPRLFSDTIFNTDSRIGFAGGEVIPIIPGSRFRVFEY